MRMWTRVLAEDDGHNWGNRFAAFYFISPRDVKAFFAQTGAANISAGVESYFADKYATDDAFRSYYTAASAASAPSADPAHIRRREFLQFYAARASAYFSKGSHDEWNIWRELNTLRMTGPENEGFGMGSQISGYFEGAQIDPGAAETPISPGYALASQQPYTAGQPSTPPPPPTVLTNTAPLTPAVKRLSGD
jgi:hypothetical protein